MKTLLIKESTATIQLRCPYCKEIQTTSTPLHIIHSPVDFWKCEFCGKISRGKAQEKDIIKCDIIKKGPIYIQKQNNEIKIYFISLLKKFHILRKYIVKYLVSFGCTTINEEEFECYALCKYHAFLIFINKADQLSNSHYSAKENRTKSAYFLWKDDIYRC